LEFAAPLLKNIPGEALEHHFREALRISFTAWNAVIFADVLDDQRHLDEIRRLTADKPEPSLLVEHLITRKRTLFASDERLIGNWEITRTEEGVNLRAEARDPHSVPLRATE
jgi:hypothetical protein